MTKRLAIAIPTYNRSGILIENLEEMLPDIANAGIPVYISDDSSDDQTSLAVSKFTSKYPNTHYIRNQPALGHDRNCLRTLELPDTDYVWYLGDAIRILPGGLNRVLSLIGSEEPDFLSVAAEHRKEITLPTGLYTGCAGIMEALAWHLTMTGTTIYSHRFLSDMQERYGHFLGTNFPQLGIILQNLPSCSKGLYWINERLVSHHQGKGNSYWKTTPFKVFMKDWADFILGLSADYPLTSKQRAIRSHSENTEVLEYRALRQLSREKKLGLRQVIQYRSYWKLVTGQSAIRVAGIALLPKL